MTVRAVLAPGAAGHSNTEVSRHHLYRRAAAAAAALLLAAGLAGPAGAAQEDCIITIDDVTVTEGNSGTTAATFTLTATGTLADDCDGVRVDWETDPNTATEGTDFTGDGDFIDLASGMITQTATISINVTGDTEFEPDEQFSVLLTTLDNATISDDEGVATITNDDPEPPGIGAGGTASATPTTGAGGTVVTVSGTKCENDTVDLILGAGNGESGGIAAETDDVPVNADDSFSGKITIPTGSDPSFTYQIVAICGADNYPAIPFDVTGMTGANGYRMVAGDGGIFTFGDRTFHGSTGSLVLNKPIVGGATDISDYDGYWIVASDGGVFTFNAEFHGSLAGQTLVSPAVEIEPTPTGKGYWIVLANGKVYTFGDANFFGDISSTRLNKPVIGMSVTPTGKGYWLVAEDGGIFNYGDAGFFGSMGDKKLNAPVIDLAPAVDNNGYYLLGRDGGVFTFGTADFKGSTGSMTLNAPVIAMLTTPTGNGYWLAASDGGVFTFGAGAEFLGSMGATKLNSPVLDLIN